MRRSSKKGYLFAVAPFFGFVCDSTFASSGCIGNGVIESNPVNLLNPDVLRLLTTSWDGAKGIVPPPYDYAVSNTSTGEYAIYTISAQYVQSSSGAVTVSPAFALTKKGTTKSGLPPASTGCPRVDGVGNLPPPGTPPVPIVPIIINPSPAPPPPPLPTPNVDVGKPTPAPPPPPRDCYELRCAKPK